MVSAGMTRQDVPESMMDGAPYLPRHTHTHVPESMIDGAPYLPRLPVSIDGYVVHTRAHTCTRTRARTHARTHTPGIGGGLELEQLHGGAGVAAELERRDPHDEVLPPRDEVTSPPRDQAT